MRDTTISGGQSAASSARVTRRVFVAGLASIALTTGAWAAGPVIEEDVLVKTPDGSAEAALFYPAGKGKWPAVLLWPDFVGLRPLYRDIGRKFAAKGFVVLVPNSFYRSVRPSDAELDPWDPAVRPTLTKYRGEATNEGIARDAVAYMAFLDARKQTDTRKKAGTIGYDLGASYAFRTAAALPGRIAAVGSDYALGVAVPRPESPHLLMPKTKAAYYIAVAQDDDKREPEDKVDIRTVMDGAGLEGVIDIYPADHGWANPAGKTYDPAATERVFDALVGLFQRTLR